MNSVIWAAGGTGFTFLMTTLGAAMVFFFRGKVNDGIQRIFLGFAAGVMIAASVWSLLIPAIDEAQAQGQIAWLPAAGGFLLGGAFLLLLDTLLPHLHPGSKEQEGVSASWKRTTLLVFAVTLHNIPEGMAVGLSFALAAQHGGDPALYAGAFALAIGIGNAHGYYKGEPEIHLDVLEAVRKFTDIPLVLHGCTGMKEDVIREAIKLGVAKINFGTEIRYKYVEHYEDGLKNLDHQGHSWKLSQYANEKLMEDVKKIILLAGSDGKA